MPILIKGSGGGAASFGVTERYSEKDAEYVSFSEDGRKLTIKPRDTAEEYGLSRIVGAANFCVHLDFDDEEKSLDMTLLWGVGNQTRNGYYLFVGKDSGEAANSRSNSFAASYDKTSGTLTISADPLSYFSGSDFDLDANVTWEIN